MAICGLVNYCDRLMRGCPSRHVRLSQCGMAMGRYWFVQVSLLTWRHFEVQGSTRLTSQIGWVTPSVEFTPVANILHNLAAIQSKSYARKPPRLCSTEQLICRPATRALGFKLQASNRSGSTALSGEARRTNIGGLLSMSTCMQS